MQVQGKLIHVADEQVISDKFKKREFVIETSDQYPQEVLIQLTQDRTTIIDRFEIDDMLTVSINIRGRRWESPQGEVKWFNTIEAWRIQSDNQQPAPQSEEGGKIPF